MLFTSCSITSLAYERTHGKGEGGGKKFHIPSRSVIHRVPVADMACVSRSKGKSIANESYPALLCPVPDVYQINGFFLNGSKEGRGTHVCVQRGRRLRETEFDTECRIPINREYTGPGLIECILPMPDIFPPPAFSST